MKNDLWCRRPLLRVSLCGLLILFSLHPVSLFAAPPGNEVRFYFNPPDSTTFVETLRHTTTITVWEQGGPQSQTQTKEFKIQYAIRKTPAGYAVEVNPLEPPSKLSEETETFLRDIVSSMHLTYALDTQGRLIRVQGIKEAFETTLKMFPPKLLDLISGMGLDVKSVDRLAANQWNDRNPLGLFAGRTIVLDQISSEVRTIALPTGKSYQASVSLKVTGSATCASSSCVRVSVSYVSNDSAIGEFLADFLRNNFINIIRSSAPDKATADRTISQIPKFAFGDPKVVYQDERVVDPATGLLYQETEIKTTQTVVNVQEQVNAKIEIRDSSEYSYRYQ